MGRLRALTWALALATLATPACSPSPWPTVSSPASSKASASASPGVPTASAGSEEEPAPSAIPSRALSLGGTATLTLADESVTFTGLQCDTARGLTIVASQGQLAAIQLSVDTQGIVTGGAFTTPGGETVLVGDFAGSATFSGTASAFTVRGEALGAKDGETDPKAFTVTGSCD